MNKRLFKVFLALLFLAMPVGLGIFGMEREVRYEQISVHYGQARPFSFYYPYNYKFYNPKERYFRNVGACYWRYTNGTYVYYCG